MKMKLRTVTDYLVYLIVRYVICLVQALPMELCNYLTRGLAVLFGDVLKIRRKVLLKNFKIAFPEWDEQQVNEAIHQCWVHLFMLAIEVAHVPRKIHDTNWRNHIELVNVTKLLSYLNAEDRPVVFVTGHFGNFEVGGYLLGLLGYPTYAVARTLDNPFLDRYIRGFRESTGQYLIAKKGGADEIVAAMDRRDIVAFLADQDAGHKGLVVDFFGQGARTYKAVAMVALQYRAVISSGFAIRKEGAGPLVFQMCVADVLDMNEDIPEADGPKPLTEWYVKALEDGIRKHPNQYWWVHDRWKGKK